MGQSQQSKASILVRTDKPYYFSGEIVKGNVYLNIVDKGFPGNILYLKVDGEETCKWTENRQQSYQDSEGRLKSMIVTDHHLGQNSFYSHKIQIHQFDVHYLPQGQYVFPFQFTLYNHLPGSFQYVENKLMASIQYIVKAEVHSFDGKPNKMEHFQELVVREPLKSQVQSLYGEMIVKSKTWCCINQGESQIRCVFDKNHYLPGDQAFLLVDIDNSDCNLDVKEIRGVLSQEIILRSNQGREFRIPKTLVNQKIDGISARSYAKDENRKSMMMVLLNQNGSENERQLKPSTNGSLVKSQYSLSTTAILSGCTCCAQHPSVSVPINIVAPVPISYEQVQQAPANWDPQTFEPVLIQFVDSDKYAKDPNHQLNFNYPSQNQNIQDLNQFTKMDQVNNLQQ